MVGKDKKVTDAIDKRGGDNIIDMINLIVQLLVDNTKYFAEKNKYFVIAMENYLPCQGLWKFYGSSK